MVRFARSLSLRIKDFVGDTKGAVAVLIASGIIVLVALVGMATDVARGYLLKSRLGQALDSAALAGGRAFFSPTRDQEIMDYFQANMPPGYMNAAVAGPNIDADENAGTVTLSATATIGTTFMRVLGYETLTVASTTEVTRESKALDLVIALDVSGSMAGSRIQGARQAALDLVDILYGADTIKDLLKIGLVPWSGKVNVTLDGQAYDPNGGTSVTVPTSYANPYTGATVDTHYFANNSPVPLLAPPPGNATTYTYDGSGPGLRFIDGGNWIVRQDGKSWRAEGFVIGSTITISDADRSGHNGTYTVVDFGTDDVTDDAISVYPGVEDDSDDTSAQISGTYNWPGCVYARYLPLGGDDDGVDFTDDEDSAFDNDADTTLGDKDIPSSSAKWAAWQPVTSEGEPLDGGEVCSGSNDGADCADCPIYGITPLQSDRTVIDAAINALQNPQGSTNGEQGLAWAWRVLMPGDPFDEATPNSELTSERQQAIILLTDGEMQGWHGNGYSGPNGTAPWGRGTSRARFNIGERLKTLADRIKNYHITHPDPHQGPIEIYTIQFGENSSELATLLKDVATKPTSPYYHFAPDEETLRSVFREVANHLSQLRISQ